MPPTPHARHAVPAQRSVSKWGMKRITLVIWVVWVPRYIPWRTKSTKAMYNYLGTYPMHHTDGQNEQNLQDE